MPGVFVPGVLSLGVPVREVFLRGILVCGMVCLGWRTRGTVPAVRSADYRRFRSYCCEAFNILRSHSRLILNLFHLMAHSSIPDFATDPDNVVLKVRHS